MYHLSWFLCFVIRVTFICESCLNIDTCRDILVQVQINNLWLPRITPQRTELLSTHVTEVLHWLPCLVLHWGLVFPYLPLLFSLLWMSPPLSSLFLSWWQEIATIADSDARGLILAGVLLPAIGWVLFNILQPALSQINKMRGGSSRGLIGAAGLSAAAASLLAAPQADAQVQEFAELAADSRPLILLFILVPAVGWVLFNILQPALKQIDNMNKK